MRAPWEWTEHDLLELISNQVTENLSLDYKECGALQRTEGKKGEVAKDVSALANSAGGVLVYGIKESGHVPIELDAGVDPLDISKEWLEQVINSRIERRIDGVRVHQVPLFGARIGRVAYIVSVPASVRAPHMASDHRYYKRFNFESVPMEDYEVRDVSRRLASPELQLGYRLRSSEEPNDAATRRLSVELFITNLNSATADYALITFYISAKRYPNVAGFEGAVADGAVSLNGLSIPVQPHKVEWRGALRLPLMQGARFHVAELSVALSPPESVAHVFWEVFTPASEIKRGHLAFRQQDGQVVSESLNSEWNLVDQRVWRI